MLGANLGKLHLGSSLRQSALPSTLVVFLQFFGHQAAPWMNQQALIAEIQSLRRDLAELSARVLALESQGAEGGSIRNSPPASPLVINYTGGSSPAALVPPFPLSRTSVGLPTPSTTSSLPSSPITLPGSSTGQVDAERAQIAEEAGRFLRRALDGTHRGTSGRERLRVSSRYYLLLREHSGVLHNPAQLHRSWNSIKPLVKPFGDCGTSVFIGWPTVQEARICCEAAGVAWPADE